LWIGCADARVPANELMGEGAGTVFVHRNVGNQVLNTDVSLMSTLQYAVDHLQVKRKKKHTHTRTRSASCCGGGL
jgi:carbonic anhydrase